MLICEIETTSDVSKASTAELTTNRSRSRTLPRPVESLKRGVARDGRGLGVAIVPISLTSVECGRAADGSAARNCGKMGRIL